MVQNITLNAQQEQAFNLVKDSNFSFFLTGRAGTGKTTLLRYIQENVRKNFAICCPTGVAAQLAGGRTINSFFSMPMTVITQRTEFPLDSNKQSLLRQVDCIIIDEVSMVSCDKIDGIDRILRRVMHSSQPFGGKQSFIRHNRSYVPAYEMLRKMMHEKKLVLETTDAQRNLVDVFNSTDGNLAAAWRNSDEKAQYALMRAILDFPYE